MRDSESKAGLWNTLNMVALGALVIWVLVKHGPKTPLKGSLAWAVIALLTSVVGEALYSRSIGATYWFLSENFSRDANPFSYWFFVGSNVFFIVLLVNFTR